jgi:hypothetical protein
MSTTLLHDKEIQRKIINLQNVRNEKAKKLRENYFNDTNIAMEWLEQNRDKFEGRFYEPMLFTVSQLTTTQTYQTSSSEFVCQHRDDLILKHQIFNLLSSYFAN